MKTMKRQDCRTDRTLASLLSGELAANERSAAEEHLSDCRSCRNRLTKMLEETRIPDHEPVPSALKTIARDMVPAQRSHGRTWLPLAAALLVVVGIGVIWGPTLPTGQERAGEAASEPNDSLRSVPRHNTLGLTKPPNDAVAGGETTSFSWQAIDGARHYDFTLVNEIGDVVFEVGTAEPSIEVLRANLALGPGHAYYWSVKATLRDGTVVDSELRAVSF